MKNKTAKQNSKMKESVSGFGCDLTEHLKSSGQDVPQVLKCCAEFIEKHGIVDGIYRLSGITSNIQKLRQEFGSKMCPDLTREVYLQDIHCVGSLCKLYFRELPNPLLTYELYRKFMDSVSVKEEHQQLQCIQSIIRELPLSHYRTLEYLIKHLTHLAAFSSQTNMHTRNLALVWAPNLLRSKENEAPACNGDSAFLEVRVQQTVVEFILNHTEQIFDDKPGQSTQREGGQSSACDGPYVTSGFPAPGQYAPMKLMSLEEARARSLNPNHPAHRECQQDDDFTEISTINTKAYHTVIDMPSNKRSFSGKSKKWKNIFNLGGSTTDTKRKLTWNGSVFIKSSKLSDKARIRPAKSMDSLCSLTKEDSEFKHPSETNGLATAAFKSHTLDSNSSYDLSKPDQVWEFEPEKVLGAMAVIHNTSKTGFKSDSMPRQRKLPEQLKVFKGEDHCHPTSPKNRRMLYPSNLNSGSTRTSFPGKLFPLESSALHQCKAVNISEPFAVSVPLRVSAVISSNSTMCRALDKDKLTHPLTEQISDAPVVEKNSERSTSSSLKKEGIQGGPSTRREAIKGENSELKEGNSKVIMMPLTTKDTTSTRSLHLQTQPSVQVKTLEQDETGKETPSHAYMTPLLPKEFVKSEKKLVGLLKQDPELRKLTEMDEKSGSNRMDEHRADVDLKEIKTNVGDTEDESLSQMTTRSKTSSPASSLPSETSKHNAITLNGNHQTVSYFTLRDMPVRQLSFDKNWDVSHNEEFKEDFKTSLMHPNNVELNKLDLAVRGKTETKSNISLPAAQSQIIFPESAKMYLGATQSHNTKTGESLNVANDELKIKEDCDTFPEKMNKKAEITKKVEHQGEAKNFDQKRSSLSLSQPMDKCLPDNDDEESLGDNTGDLDLVEPWEDSGIRQWVTSPLHSPKILNFFQSEEELLSCLMGESYKSNKCVTEGNQNELSGKSTEKSSGKSLQVYHHKTKTCTENIHSPAWENIQVNEMNQKSKEKDENSPKQINNCSFRRQKRQRSQDNSYTQKADEKPVIKQRPHSLNLNLETLYIKDASEQENADFLPGVLLSQKSLPKYGSPTLELKKFLCDRQASMRRNSAPVSVSSVRTSFMIKTCQAKAVPVIAPKIQYSQIPQPMVVNNANCLPNKELENDLTENGKTKTDTTSPLPSTSVKIKQSGQPASTNLLNASNGYGTPCPKKPSVLRTSSNGDAIGDFVRQERSTVMKRPSFRARPNRPQSLILFSPPFPIMDCPPSGDDDRIHLSPIRSPTEVVAPDTFSKEFAEFDSVSLRNKMTMPKSGQRLETSTSCFYQPQRRSMIFDNRGKTD